MSASNLVSYVDDVTRCPICLEECTDPRCLPCLHTFCFKCIERQCEDKCPGDEVPCSMCREEFEIPKGGVGQLRRNFFVDGLISNKNAARRAECQAVGLRKPSESKEVCRRCAEKHSREVRASVYCMGCAQNLCNSCVKDCTSSDAKVHKVVKLKDETSHDSRTHRGNYCDTHSNELLRMYCTQCQSSICTQCHDNEHYDHKCINIVKAANEFRDEITARMSRLQMKLHEVHEHHEHLRSSHRSFKNNVATVSDSIKRTADGVRKHASGRTKHRLEAEQSDLLQQLKSVEAQTEKSVMAKDERFELTRMTLESFINYAKEIVKKGSPADMTRAVNDLRARANELQKNECSLYCPPTIVFKPTGSGKRAFGKTSGNLIGELSFESVIQFGPPHACSGRQNDATIPNGSHVSVDKLDVNGATPLYTAADEGHLETVRHLMRNGASIHAPTNDGITPLMAACRKGHLDVVKFLIKNGASVDATDNDGRTPLDRAAFGGHLDVVKMLIDNHASLHKRAGNGATPLYVAAQEGHLKIVQYLMEKGMSTRIPRNDGDVPLMAAARNGRSEVVKLLIHSGVSVDISDNDGRAALHDAALNGHLDVVKILVISHALVDKPAVSGATALYVAAEEGHLETVRYLMEKGASICTPMNDGRTPLMAAARNGRCEVVQFLIDNGAPVDARDKDGRTALYWAKVNDHLDVIQILVKHGATVDSPGNQGCSPRYAAAQNGHSGTNQRLIDNGASANHRSRNGNSPVVISAAEVANIIDNMTVEGQPSKRTFQSQANITAVQNESSAMTVRSQSWNNVTVESQSSSRTVQRRVAYSTNLSS